jgi:ubiquitin-like protein Pup
MARQERVQKSKTDKTTAPPEATKKTDQKAVGEKIKHDLDDILDEIDEVLEDNAAEFVKNYVQKGGQ